MTSLELLEMPFCQHYLPCANIYWQMLPSDNKDLDSDILCLSRKGPSTDPTDKVLCAIAYVKSDSTWR